MLESVDPAFLDLLFFFFSPIKFLLFLKIYIYIYIYESVEPENSLICLLLFNSRDFWLLVSTHSVSFPLFSNKVLLIKDIIKLVSSVFALWCLVVDA